MAHQNKGRMALGAGAPFPFVLGILLAACADGEPKANTNSALRFMDVTAESGIAFTTTSGRTPSSQILEVKGGGMALIDFDGDDDLDLFVPNGATLDQPNAGPGCRLFENMGDMRFRDATSSAGLDGFRRWGFGVAVADVDGNGFDDLFVACYGKDVLLHNQGGRFVDVSADSEFEQANWSTDAAFGDLDGDGDLDLYVTCFCDFDPAQPPPGTTFLGAEVFLGPRGLSPTHDLAYENQGDGTFRDVSVEWGLRRVEPSYGLGTVIIDFDDDGRPEIFVGNDSGANFLFTRKARNQFDDIGLRSGLAVNENGLEQATMGIAIADVSGNKLPDVYTSNFMNDTNTLHVNLGDLLFEDRTRKHGLGMETQPFLGWATLFADFDHDGDEDLAVFNGHVYPRSITEPRQWRHAQQPLLYERVGERFDRASANMAGSWLAETHCDRSAVAGDLDQDGDVDMIVGELNGPLRVLQNVGARGQWLTVTLEDPTHPLNHAGLGSRVVVRTAAGDLVRWSHGKGGYQSGQPARLHFGLAGPDPELQVDVKWPDGGTSTLEGVTPNTHAHIVRR